MRYGILGPVEVRDGDRVLDVGTPKQRAVLVALLVSANRVVSLDRLIDGLWGEGPPAAATGTLQAYVANLRRVLEPGRASRAAATVLVTQAPGYLLRVEASDVDAVRFEQLVTEGRQLLAAERPRAAHDVLGEALGLWRGPALADVADYEFAAAEIARLDDLRLAAREAQAEAMLALGRHGETVPALERLVAGHLWRERPRELLMLALYRCGRQAEALELMAQTRLTFAEELGIDPGPRLQELHAAILRQEPALAWRGVPAEPTPPVPVPTRAEATHRVEERPASGLVGRAKPLATLRGALDDAVAGRGRVVLVAGEPGIGKTRLVQELAATTTDHGADVVWGRCHENEAAPAFWPWTQVLRALSAAREPAELATVARAAGPHLAPLAPELAGDGAAPVALPEQARLLLYDAATRLLLGLATHRPLLLILEDLHWSDPPSLELAAYLASQLDDARILLVTTFREQASTDQSLATMLAAVAREPRTERLRLTGLSPEQVGQMVAERSGLRVDERLADALHARTDGNPFFVTELTRLLRSEGRLNDPTTWPVPENVRDVLRHRIARLPEQAVTVLTIGAVIGRSFDVDVLQRASGLDEERLLVAVEAAVITGLLIEHPSFPGRYRFVHALVRQTLYETLSGIRRARLHARIGEALQACYGDRDVDALAHHFWHAGPAAPAEHALTHLQRAAETAEQSLAFERAIEQLQRAVSLIGRLEPGPGTDERELDVQRSLAALLLRTRGYAAPDVMSAFGRLRILALATGRSTELGESLWGLWAGRCVAADFPDAECLGEELMALARDTGDREIERAAHHALGIVAWHQGRYSVADAHLSAGIVLADDSDGRPLLRLDAAVGMSLRGFRSAVRWLLGDPDGAAALCSEALALASGDSVFSRVFALFHAANLAVYERDPEATRRFASEAISLSREHGFALFDGMCEVFDGWAAALQGEPGTQRIRAAQDRIAATGTRMLRHYFLGLRAEAELAEGRPDDARATLAEAFAEVAATGECFYEPALRRLQAELA